MGKFIIFQLSTMSLFVLFESSIGYGLFKLKEFDDVNST